jgi:hypothetical protein
MGQNADGPDAAAKVLQADDFVPLRDPGGSHGVDRRHVAEVWQNATLDHLIKEADHAGDPGLVHGWKATQYLMIELDGQHLFNSSAIHVYF